MRTDWTERTERPGWEIRYVNIGGHPVEQDPLELLEGPQQTFAERATSNAFVAITASSPGASEDVQYWATLVSKFVQRGSRPPIPYQAADAVKDRSRRTLTARDVLASLTPAVPVELDPSYQLHETYEQPFWRRLLEVCPDITPWCVPQAPLEALAGVDSGDRERWVDFLFTVPWNERPFVLEIDGAGHERQRGIDQERDAALEGIARVRRIKGGAREEAEALLTEVKNRFQAFRGDPQAWATRLVWGPAAINRTMYALAEAVVAGFLPPGADWAIALEDDTGAVEEALGSILGVLRSLGDIWQIQAVPDQIVVNRRAWAITQSGEYTVMGSAQAEPQVRIAIRTQEAPHHHLPTPDRPTVVVRSAYLPVDLMWDPPLSRERRNVTVDSDGRRGLHHLLRSLYGFEDFREGQLSAITRVLSGGDACVLLATGAGKTLIYQMAGLLRPGTTIVAAPLIALIDDQERRMVGMGIDRCVAITSERGDAVSDRMALLDQVRTGDGLFIIIAPERLQIESFRQALLDGAAEGLVNLAVIDEAHCVSEWGHQFRPAYLTLGRNLRRYGRGADDVEPPLLALTGTASPAVLRDVLLELEMKRDEPGILHRPNDFDRPNLHYSIAEPNPDRLEGLRFALRKVASDLGVDLSDLAALKGPDTTSGIVFTPHVNSGRHLGIEAAASTVADELSLDPRVGLARFSGKRWSSGKRYPGFGRADLEAWDSASWADFKRLNADAFRTNKVGVMIATNAFGMGIDKPNIRWTIHLTHPNSLEAFAQEAGRAGRDGKPASCVLIASPATGDKSDLEIQNYFLQTTFPDPEEEYERTARVIQELVPEAAPAREVLIPKGSGDQETEIRQRALYRLVILGLLDDYTIERNSFTVHFARFSVDSLQESIRSYVARVTGGRRDREAVITEDYSSLEERLLSYARLMVDVLYETVVPGRRRALHEMNRLAQDRPPPEEIRRRINAYLGAGEVSLLMDKVVQQDSVHLGEAIKELRELHPVGQEWAAASNRFLESYPDHPVMLLVNALGEAWLESGDKEAFHQVVTTMFSRLGAYGVSADEGVEALRWVLFSLRTYFNRERWPWAPIVWAAWSETPWSDELLIPLEDEVLNRAANGRYEPWELDLVLARRLRRIGDVELEGSP